MDRIFKLTLFIAAVCVVFLSIKVFSEGESLNHSRFQAIALQSGSGTGDFHSTSSTLVVLDTVTGRIYGPSGTTIAVGETEVGAYSCVAQVVRTD